MNARTLEDGWPQCAALLSEFRARHDLPARESLGDEQQLPRELRPFAAEVAVLMIESTELRRQAAAVLPQDYARDFIRRFDPAFPALRNWDTLSSGEALRAFVFFELAYDLVVMAATGERYVNAVDYEAT